MTILRTERHLEETLFAEWQQLREAGRLDNVLPPCTTHQWKREDGVQGYVTVDYRAMRQLALPGVWGHDRDGRTDLVEFYWSVRTVNGRQNPTWMPSFNANVVELKNEALSTAHLEQVYRYTLALRHALFSTRLGDLAREGRVNVYVRGLLIGTEVPESVAFVDALATWSDMPLFVAKYHVSATGGILFERTGSEERFWNLGHDLSKLQRVGSSILGGDSLTLSNGEWPGVNRASVYDASAGAPTPVEISIDA